MDGGTVRTYARNDPTLAGALAAAGVPVAPGEHRDPTVFGHLAAGALLLLALGIGWLVNHRRRHTRERG